MEKKFTLGDFACDRIGCGNDAKWRGIVTANGMWKFVAHACDDHKKAMHEIIEVMTGDPE